MTKEGSNKIVSFMTFGVRVLVLRCGHISYIVKIHYFFKNLLLYSQAQIRKTEGMIITIGAGCLMLGRGFISHYSEYTLSSALSIHITLIDIVLREYNAAFLCHCWFLLFYDGATDMQIWALLTRSQCRISDIRWPLRPLGLLFIVAMYNILKEN